MIYVIGIDICYKTKVISNVRETLNTDTHAQNHPHMGGRKYTISSKRVPGELRTIKLTNVDRGESFIIDILPQHKI